MKAKFQLAVALLAGAAVGAGAMQGLHAQATPKGYAIIENTVTDQAAYSRMITPVIKAITDAGGKYEVRGNKYSVIKGTEPKPATVIEVIEYDNMVKAELAYSSPVWNDARKLSQIYDNARILIVEGVPQ
ncbi:MAG TPA: DUF1330 domain-containing protein [Pseudolabrys sp.]